MTPHADEDRSEITRLRAEAGWYRTLFEQGPVPMIIYDPASLQILAANGAAAGAYGYPNGALERLAITDLAADPPEAVRRRNAGLPEAATRIGVLTHRRRGGEAFQVEITSQAIDYDGRRVRLAIVLDVTERVRAETAVRNSEARFRALVENSSEGITLLDAQGRALYASHAVYRMLGLEPRALCGRPLSGFVHPEDRAAMAASLAEAVRRPGVAVRLQARYRHRDGAWRHLEVVRSSHLDDPAVGAVVNHYRDVTERLDLEAKLRLADRMASVGTLAAGVAHEINNPLAYVLANLAFVAETLRPGRTRLGPEADEVFAALEEARTGADRVREIVGDLKTFSRSEGRRGPVDVHLVLDGTCAIAGNEIRHRARLEKRYAPQLPCADGDESHLAQVFLNLLVNAVQAIPEGDGESHTIRITTTLAGDGRLDVAIADDGTGIPEADRARIFDPFFTTKPVGVGTGLGLSICRNLVTRGGGELTVESEAGRGTTFHVWLPVAAAAPSVISRAVPASVPGGRRGRVLIIDDEPLIGKAASRILGADHEVVVETTGAAALARLRAGERFDVILCDVMMPEMSGMDLWSALVPAFPWAPARTVFMTGGAFTPAAAEFLETVDAPKVDKPFDGHALRVLVRARVVEARAAEG